MEESVGPEATRAWQGSRPAGRVPGLPGSTDRDQPLRSRPDVARERGARTRGAVEPEEGWRVQRAEATQAAARQGLAGGVAHRRQERAPESRRRAQSRSLPGPAPRPRDRDPAPAPPPETPPLAPVGSPHQEIGVRKAKSIPSVKHFCRPVRTRRLAHMPRLSAVLFDAQRVSGVAASSPSHAFRRFPQAQRPIAAPAGMWVPPPHRTFLRDQTLPLGLRWAGRLP